MQIVLVGFQKFTDRKPRSIMMQSSEFECLAKIISNHTRQTFDMMFISAKLPKYRLVDVTATLG